MGRGLFELTVKTGRVRICRAQVMVDHKDAKDLADAVADLLDNEGRPDARNVRVEVRKPNGEWIKEVSI